MLLKHLRSNIVAYLALVVALSTGTAYAAAQIANGSVTTKKLAKNAVTSNKVKNDAIKGRDIKNGSVGFFDIGDGAVSSGEIFNGSVRSEDIQNDTITRSDIAAGVVPADGDVFVSDTGAPPTATPDSPSVSSFQFTLPRNGKVHVQFFSGAFGVTCTPEPGHAGLYVDGAPKTGTRTDVPSSTAAGALLLATSDFLSAGVHTVSVAADCPTGVPSEPVVARRPVWAVNLLAR